MLQFKYYILAAVIPAHVRQMGVKHRCGICFRNLLWAVTVPLAKRETLDQDHFPGCKIKILNLNPSIRLLFHLSLHCTTSLVAYTTCYYSSYVTVKMRLRVRSFGDDLYYTHGLSQEPVSKCLKQNKSLDMAFGFRLELFKRQKNKVGCFGFFFWSLFLCQAFSYSKPIMTVMTDDGDADA